MNPPSARPPYPLLGLFVVLATAIAAIAYHYHVEQKEAIEREVHNQLLAIADMKVKHISSWREEKLGEARMVARSGLTLAGLERFMKGRSTAEERRWVAQWMSALCEELHYAGATLSDVNGNIVLSQGRRFGDERHIRELTRKVLAMTDVALTDFHADPGAPIHLGLNIPLRHSPESPAFGALLAGVDPRDSLYPMVQRWPIPSATAESLIVRRDGDDALFLSPLRKFANPPATLRIPIRDNRVAAVRSLLGEQGPILARDYSGTPVLAAVQPVPNTTWQIVTKMDAEEVLAPLRWRSTLASALALSLIAVAGATVYVLWRRHQVEAYRAGYESELARREAAERYEDERRAMTEELRRSMQALGASESRFRGAFEQAAVGMTQVSADGHFLRVNQRFCEIAGYSRQELLGMTYSDLTYSEDRMQDPRYVAPLLAGETPVAHWTKRYVRKNGEIIWVAITVSPLRIGDEPLYMLEVVEDITGHVRAREALEQSEERFRVLVEGAPDGILVVSRDLRIRYANPRAVEMFGAGSAEALCGSCLLDRVHPDERDAARGRLETVAGGTPIARTERRLLKTDGKEFPAEIHAGGIVYDGQPAALTFFRDITEAKRAEEDRLRLEQRLAQAQKMETVGRLAGGVAHDFNNHLTVINGYCDMLLEALAADDSLRDELEEIRAAGDRAAALTQQLLAFSRKQIVAPRPILLNHVVEEFGRLVRRLIGDDVEVVTELEPALGAVMADKGQMHQVLMNLAINARDAMPEGGRIVVSTANVDLEEQGAAYVDAKTGHYVLLTVSDTGAGMSQETIQKIFEPFFTTKPMGVGTGLGLATVYGIVEQSGGFIRVASEVGRGTTIRIYLPRIPGNAELITAAPGAQASAGGTETVLVVEDQAEVRKLATGILKRNGYRLLEASSGPEALEIAAAFGGEIDLLVTDVVMPGMTGRELATRLRAARPAIKVLYTSGYSADVIARQGVLDAGVAYLPKPFGPADLAQKAREVLGVA